MIYAMFKLAAHKMFANEVAFGRFIGWRRSVLKRRHIEKHGNQVLYGPMKGLRLDPTQSELPKFIGTYEHMLHHWLQAAVARGYSTILNIGCAEGYYAIGLARLLPEAAVSAFDINPDQQSYCRLNAELNGVAHRVVVSGQFEGRMFADHADSRTLVVCDIEGGEIELLRPERWPALARMDLLVELHEEHMPNLPEEFCRRFSTTHHIQHIVRSYPSDVTLLDRLFPKEQDQLPALYENRFGPTSWMALTSRAFSERV
jgi:Met-10+ like-protein